MEYYFNCGNNGFLAGFLYLQFAPTMQTEFNLRIEMDGWWGWKQIGDAIIGDQLLHIDFEQFYGRVGGFFLIDRDILKNSE